MPHFAFGRLGSILDLGKKLGSTQMPRWATRLLQARRNRGTAPWRRSLRASYAGRPDLAADHVFSIGTSCRSLCTRNTLPCLSAQAVEGLAQDQEPRATRHGAGKLVVQMTTLSRLLAEKQRLMEQLQEDIGPEERDEIERLLEKIDAALDSLDKAGPGGPSEGD
jgi:hypothetical protein